jgi:hypothetical protein
MQQHGHSDSGDMLVVGDHSQLSPVCQRLIAYSDALIAQTRQLRAECAALAAQLDQRRQAALDAAQRGMPTKTP